MSLTPEMIDRLEMYLDGLLEGAALAAFEREVGVNAELRAEVEAARRVESVLRASMSPPQAIALPALDRAVESAPLKFDAAGSGGKPKRAPAWRWAGYAAAAAIGLAAVAWYSNTVPNPSAKPVLTAMQVLEETRRTGFTPVFVCKDDAEFAATVKNRFGTAMLVAAQEGVAVLGWAYSDTYAGEIVSNNTLVLMAKVDGREVLVFMDKAPGARTLSLGERPDGYRVFKKELGGLVLYELSPFDRARVLDACYVPPGG